MRTKFFTVSIIILILSVKWLSAQRGYYDAPYIRYEADVAVLSNGAEITPKSYAQTKLQSEASGQVCVNMSSVEATAEFTFSEPADGLVIRYSVPDGDSAVIGVYHDNVKITSLALTSKWSWEYLWNNGDPNNNGITNKNPRMRFDEVRYKLPEKVTDLKLVKESGNLWLDFVEMEPVPEALNPPEGAVFFNGDGSTLQAFIDENGSKTIFIPEGVYHIHSQLYFGVSKTKLQGAGMWYSQLNFTVTDESNGGLRANAEDICYADLFITSEKTGRTNGYGGIHGVYTKGSTIKNMWVEHCATGAWIGQYTPIGPAFADGFTMSDCRFRNTYADGVNLCKGTRNAIVEHCNFRNNGDDGQAIWCADGLECINNTFRYNTVENGWRAAGAALYGGKDNKFYNIIIKDNTDVGITITNLFDGVGFNENGLHDFHNITITGCGTFNAIYNDRVGAININHASSAGTKVQNIRLYNIDILDSKCDAIRISKSSGEGIYNLSFENVTIDGTGTEFPDNNVNGNTGKRGFAVYFDKYPIGNATYCGLESSNLGGNAEGVEFGTSYVGNFEWKELTGCEPTAVSGVSLTPADTSVSGGATVQLIPVFTPSNASNKIVSYTSANPGVAAVNYDGLVTGLSKGETTITVVTQDGNFTASSNVVVSSDPIIYYRIRNRWQNTFLYDAGDRVKYSNNANGDLYLWDFEEIEGGMEIKNISTGDYMHIENLLGFVECTTRSPDSLASSWMIENVDAEFIRLKSELNTTDYIHIENLQNQAQYGDIEAGWWSAMWALEPVFVSTSVKNQLRSTSKAEIYPNPSKGKFHLSMHNFASNGEVAIIIYNLAGQAMYTNKFNVDSSGSCNLEIETGNALFPGNYIVVASGDSSLATVNLLISE